MRWKELAAGYTAQVVATALLLVQHFFLPFILGLEEYGRLAVMTGAATLTFCFFDHGINLLVVRKRRLAHRYLSLKYALLAVFSLPALLFGLFSLHVNPVLVVCVVIHSLCFCTYTFFVYLEVAKGRVNLTVLYSLISGTLLVLCPLTLFLFSADVIFASVIANFLSVLIIIRIRGTRDSLQLILAAIKIRIKVTFSLKVLLRQAQLSLVTIIDAVIVWLGVIVVGLTQSIEEAAIFRVVMSVIGVMVQITPMPKHIVMKAVRSGTSTRIVMNFMAILTGVGLLQAILLLLLAPVVVPIFFKQRSDDIITGISMLCLAPCLRAIFEIETIFVDYYRRHRDLSIAALLSLFIGSCVYLIGIYESIISIYAVLCLTGALSIRGYLKSQS